MNRRRSREDLSLDRIVGHHFDKAARFLEVHPALL